jgi:hypothetical protein
MIKKIRILRRDIRETKFLPNFGELGEKRMKSISEKHDIKLILKK